MSMSQEEIEALMGGTETPKDEDLDNDIKNDVEIEEEVKLESAKTVPNNDESLDSHAQEILSNVSKELDKRDDNLKQTYSPGSVELKNLDTNSLNEGQLKKMQDEVAKVEPNTKNKQDTEDEIGKSWTDHKISEGVFPLPVEKNHKVVSQLSEVANDSEENASKIFDVLSYILDENAEVEKDSKKFSEFCDKQRVLLETLSEKFPNIGIFKANLENVLTMQKITKDLSERVENENSKLFEAMELMQFHDINRQKIERVMAVIRKLSSYLSNLFEDDNSHPDIAVAKHIHGDENADLIDDQDLSALIAEFGNQGDKK